MYMIVFFYGTGKSMRVPLAIMVVVVGMVQGFPHGRGGVLNACSSWGGGTVDSKVLPPGGMK